jgi:outer membrane protein assembly factor BamB
VRVVVTSNVRYATPSEGSAYLRVLDLETGSLLLTTQVPESSFRTIDPNPRGGQRGGRGLSVYGGRLVVANAERLFVLDTSWRLVDELSHPLAGDIHDVLAEERGVWVASTACDALVLLDWDGEAKDVWTYRSDRGLVRQLGLPRRALPPFDANADYRDPRNRSDEDDSAHLNSVVRDGDRLLVMLGQIHGRTEKTWQDAWSAVVELALDGKPLAKARASVLCRRDGLVVPNHNVARLGGLVVFNDSNGNRLVAVDPRTGETRCSVEIPGDPPYARGLAPLGDGRWLVGSQRPLAVHAVDLARGEVVQTWAFDAPEDESVYAVCLLPDEFSTPPQLSGAAAELFWRRATLPAGVTPIPAQNAGTKRVKANG